MELLKIKDLIPLLKLSRSEIHIRRKQGKFPKSIQAMLPTLRWRKADIMDWLNDSN